MELWWGYLILGMAAGIVGASLGVGGGIILVPALVVIFHLPQKSAQGTSLAVMAMLTLAGAIRYWMDPAININLSVVALIGLTAVIGAIAGAAIAAHVPAHMLRKAFAVLMVIAAIRMGFSKPRNSPPPSPAASAPSLTPLDGGEGQ